MEVPEGRTDGGLRGKGDFSSSPTGFLVACSAPMPPTHAANVPVFVRGAFLYRGGKGGERVVVCKSHSCTTPSATLMVNYWR